MRAIVAATAVMLWSMWAVACGGSPRQAPPTSQVTPTGPAPAGEWQLVWSDEFAGPNGAAPDPARWVFDLGGGGWGNNELQSYTDRRENAVVRDGMLVIRAARETFTGADGTTRGYTSTRLKTLGRFRQTYGRFEGRMRIPRGQGIWPAFWMLGEDIETTGWPGCGEIDIMENIGREPALVHGTLHGPGYSGAQGIGSSYSSPTGRAFADDFHVFGVEWEPQSIRWSVDGMVYHTRTPADLRGARWVFDHPFFLLINVAVGGNWPGNPDATTVFPQELVLDWVRAYARSGTGGLAGIAAPRRHSPRSISGTKTSKP
jgi:beta-glucanase (GH16 family)